MSIALSVGQLLIGRYQVEQKLATGGQATLYRATDRRITGKTWAIKVYQTTPGTEAEAREQWRSEIDVLRRTHRALPHLGEHFEGDGSLYLVLDYLDGQTLDTLISGGAACASEKTALTWAADLADALAELHQPDADGVRFIYADLKPQNIMRTADGRLFLVDFGSARALRNGAAEVPSLRLGTPGFAAPEQGNSVSESTDVYGLGATLTYLLTGQTIERFPPDAPLAGPQGPVTPALAALLRRATNFDPSGRYASMQQMQAALLSLEQVCVTCGTLTRPGARFCPICGAPRDALAQRLRSSASVGTHRSVELRPTEFEQDRIENHPVLNRLRLPVTAPLKLLLLRAEGERLALDRGFEDGLIALDALNIDTYAHQHNAVLKMLREMRGNGIFADEVGLGKTIEAGMVLKELLVRGLVRSVLILVRPGTTDQWKEEMEDKINEHFTVYDSKRKWRPSERIIISLDTARQAKRRDAFLGKTFDLIIVDEAHRLYNKTGRTNAAWDFVNALQRKYLLLLTATPIRGHLGELFSLVTLVRPGQFRSRQDFLQRYADSRAADKALQRQELKTVLAEVMIRNRRRDSTIRFPQKREIEQPPIPLQGDELRCYALVEGAIRLDCSRDHHLNSNWERISTYRPLLQAACISRQAVRDFLESRQTLREQPHWQQVLAAVSKPGIDAKEVALRDLLRRLNDRAIVYVEHPATAQRLHSFLLLSKPPMDVALYLQEKDRHEALKQFRQSKRGVLLAGRPVEESLNLQFCHLVVNYDIPWDPTRLEQRIGRVHRLGQLYDVNVYSLVSQGTYAQHLLRLYRSSLRLFELEVGELGMVLDEMDESFNFERELWELWLNNPDPSAQEHALTVIGSKLAQARTDFEQSMRGAAAINDIFEG